MSGRVETKRRVYDSDEEFRVDRSKLWADGWVVVESQIVRQRWKRRNFAPDLGHVPFVGLILLAPLILLAWLIARKAPEEEIFVVYQRDGRDGASASARPVPLGH